jgi:circadian clock protein KaiB
MPKYRIHLYVTGQTTRSLHAVANLRRICELHLSGNYELVLIDVLEQPDVAEAARILATPTTIRTAPLPAYRVIGDLSDPSKVIMALGLDMATDLTSARKEQS